VKGLRSWRPAATILGIALLVAVGVCCLPNDSYQRAQLLDRTIYQSLRWSYERIHFDPRPVDVAIVGPSTAVLGLNAARIQSDLESAGKPAQVANFAIIATGRNIEWAILHELYKAKKPKVVVVAVDERPALFGHNGFKYFAPAAAIVSPPAIYLHNAFYDLSYLPYRQLELFAAWLLPDAVGLTKRFDPVKYASFRTDNTVTHVMEDGEVVEMDRRIPKEALQDQARRRVWQHGPKFIPGRIANIVDSDDHAYIDLISRDAAAHGAKVIFLYIPFYDGAPRVDDREYLEKRGMLVENSDLAQRDDLYQGSAHLNHAGALVLSDRVASIVAAYL
jgi:hypothetical protein